MSWRLLIEEYGPELIYIPGPDNTNADALSRMPLSECFLNEKVVTENEKHVAEALAELEVSESNLIETNITMEDMSESFCVEKLDNDTFPLTYKTIDKFQRKDKTY